MKVILVNGSPHEKGCTYTALQTVAQTLNEEGIKSEIFQLGSKPLVGCTAYGGCAQTGQRTSRSPRVKTSFGRILSDNCPPQ